MKYSDIRKFDATNGHGIATTLFVSGCNFHCKGCFNNEAWDFNYGKKFTQEVENKFIEYCKNKHINHISLLGGEVFQQDSNVILQLVKKIKEEVNKPIWIWTGYLFEDLILDKDKIEILGYVDVLVDGRFELNKKDINLLFRGSSNQRIIDVQKSLRQNKIVKYGF